MAILTSILSSDIVSDSRSTINNNFQNLNAQIKTVYKNTPQSVASSVLTADTELVFPVLANEKWRLYTTLIYTSNITADLKFTYLAPPGTAGYFNDDDANGTALTPSVIGTVSTTSDTPNIVGIHGVFVTSVAGNISLHWAQNTNMTPSVVTVFAGSNMIGTKLD